MLRISGKDGPYGKQPKKRVVPLSRRPQEPLEAYFALHERWVIGSAPCTKDRQTSRRSFWSRLEILD
jgi:site-specific recombinase XerD